MAKRTFILDSAALDLIGQRLHVALCAESDSGRVLGTGISASADDALTTALCTAVASNGFPGVVLIDHAADMPDLVRECWLMGVEIASVPPYSGTAKPIERAFRDLHVHLSQEAGQ